MPHEEMTNRRDRSYSAWHRRNSTRRFVGIEMAQLLVMIDLDASLYVECDDRGKEPLALIETAKDVGQPYKNATVTTNLARRADLPALILLYTLSTRKNPADPRFQDIEWFRVKRTYPTPETGWKLLKPQTWAQLLVKLRKSSAEMLDTLDGYEGIQDDPGTCIREISSNGHPYDEAFKE